MNINIKSIIMLTASAILFGGCDKPQTTSTNASQQTPPVQAQPFHGQVYKSLNGAYEVSSVLTLISPDECEFLDRYKQTTLCKYTKSDNKLRVVTQLGQVTYFQFTDEGLVDNDRVIYFSPEGLAARMQQHQQEELRLEQEREAKQKKEAEEQQHMKAIIASEDYNLVYYKEMELSERVEDMGGTKGYMGYPLTTSPNKISLFDSLIQVWFITRPPAGGGGPYEGYEYIFFHRFEKIGDLGEGTQNDSFFIDVDKAVTNHGDSSGYPSHLILHFKSQADAQKFHDTLVSAYNTWKQKNPEAVWK